MTYDTPQALRRALEHRLLVRSTETGISLDRFRRRVLFERILARLVSAEPGRWVLKGGMALEVRLRDDARLTKDIDLGLRDGIVDPANLRERLIDALSADLDGDGFVLTVGPPKRLGEDSRGHPTWRVRIAASMADRPFGGIHLDVSPRTHELDDTDRVLLPNSFDFAGLPTLEVEIIDVHRHAAEKLHAMFRDFGDRENTRVRDLVDLIILIEHGLLVHSRVAIAVRKVWVERERAGPPEVIPDPPESWIGRYELLAADQGLATRAFPAAIASVARLWAEMFRTEEN